MNFFMRNNSLVPIHKMNISFEEINIPRRVADLLWKTEEKPDASVLHGGLTISLNFDISSGEIKMDSSLGREPSLIYLKLPISKPAKPDSVPPPSYFPSYASLTPEQKYIYLKWLGDITKPINIGYVFIYYYGLERHLLLGNIDLAVKEIMLLRKHHLNGSFQGYSRQGIISACVQKNRSDILKEIAKDLKSEHLDNMIIHLYKRLNYDLEAMDLIGIASRVGFANKRYIKSHLEIFMNKLNAVLVEKYAQSSFPLERYNIENLPKYPEILFANHSFPNNLRTAQLPSYFECAIFKDDVKGLLLLAHEQTKAVISKARRKKR